MKNTILIKVCLSMYFFGFCWACAWLSLFVSKRLVPTLILLNLSVISLIFFVIYLKEGFK